MQTANVQRSLFRISKIKNRELHGFLVHVAAGFCCFDRLIFAQIQLPRYAELILYPAEFFAYRRCCERHHHVAAGR